MQTTTEAPGVRARKDQIQRLARERLGVGTIKALASQLDVDVSNLSRVLNGVHEPSNILIAVLLYRLGVKFEDVFTITIEHVSKT